MRWVQLQRLVVGLRRQRDDQVEVEPLQVLQLLEGDRLGAGRCRCRPRPSPPRRTDRARPCCTPADASVDRRPSICLRSSASAIGERTEFSPQANSTACGMARRGGSATASALPVQDAEQREQPARGVEVHARPCSSARPAGCASLRRAAPRRRHVDRLDAVGRRGADRLIVAVADHVVVLDDPPQRRERQTDAPSPACRPRGGCRTPAGCR